MSSTNLTALRGHCPAPFFDEHSFELSGGLVSGRICMPIAQLNTSCCVPCPYTDWMYADGFNQRTEIASWVNVAAIFSTLFVLLSFVILPVKWTHRHYLGVCLSIGVLFIELAFIIPLAVQPEQCYNEITPNDMRSDVTCAISGSFLMFGGWAVVIWVFWRALSLHLQICWEVIPGKKFFWSTITIGWIIPAVGLTTTLTLTGVSYRFGNVCHINHKDGLQDFWGPLLAFATLALVLQFITLGYCVQVYVKTLFSDKVSTENSSSIVPTYSGSIATVSAKQAYRRVSRVVSLQWRGAMIVLLIIAEVVFFSVVFVSMDNSTQVNDQLLQKAMPWVTCLVLSNGNKNECLPQASALVKPEGIVIAVLICLGLSGFWLLIFLGRWSMILGWKDFFKTKMLNRRHEFVSADARPYTNDPRTYEMLDAAKSTPGLNIASPERVLSPGQAHPLRSSPMTPEPDSKQDYFGRKIVVRTSNAPNFSTPIVPTSPNMFSAREWDYRSTQAKSTTPVTPGTVL